MQPRAEGGRADAVSLDYWEGRVASGLSDQKIEALKRPDDEVHFLDANQTSASRFTILKKAVLFHFILIAIRCIQHPLQPPD